MWVLGTRPRSSARAARTLNYWDLSRDPVCFWFTGWKPLHLPDVYPVHFAPSICFVTLISLWSCVSSLSPSAIVACLLWIPLQHTILTHADRTYSHCCPPLSKDHAASRMSFFIRCNLGEITSWLKDAARARLTQNTTLEILSVTSYAKQVPPDTLRFQSFLCFELSAIPFFHSWIQLKFQLFHVHGTFPFFDFQCPFQSLPGSSVIICAISQID